MRSLRWPLPSMIAGSLRTAIGNSAGKSFSLATAKQLLEVGARGVLPYADGNLYLPAPQDCVVHPDEGPIRTIPQSFSAGDGCDLPDAALMPVTLPRSKGTEFKPASKPMWWPITSYVDWLLGNPMVFDRCFLIAPPEDNRTHVRITPETGAAKEAMLFTTSSLPLTHLPRYGSKPSDPFDDRFAEIKLLAAVEAKDWCLETAQKLDTRFTAGGERRLAHLKADGRGSVWDCPPSIRQELTNARYVTMVLASPAIFKHGWRPAWLDDDLTGSPRRGEPQLRLRAVSIDRWRAVSGWSLIELSKDQPRGPKPTRRMVPAGGVYYFEVVGEPGAEALADIWLRSVSDDPQDQRDGFGLATWGIWKGNHKTG